MESEQYVQVMNANAKTGMNGSMSKYAGDGYPNTGYQSAANGYLPGQTQNQPPMGMSAPPGSYEAQAAAAAAAGGGPYYVTGPGQVNSYHANNTVFSRFAAQHGFVVNSAQNSASPNANAQTQPGGAPLSRPASSNSLTHDGRSSDSNVSLSAYPPQSFTFQANVASPYGAQAPQQQFAYGNGAPYQNGAYQFGAPQNFAPNFQNAPANYPHQAAFNQQSGPPAFQQQVAPFGHAHQTFANGPPQKGASQSQFTHTVPNGYAPQPQLQLQSQSQSQPSAIATGSRSALIEPVSPSDSAQHGQAHAPQATQSQSQPASASAVTKHPADMVEKLFASVGNEPPARAFVDRYLQFLDQAGEPLTSLPKIAKQTLNLFRLYETVRGLGGMQEVIKRKKWKEVGVGLLENVAASTALRRAYCKYLFAFECFVDRANQDPKPILNALEAQLQAKRTKVRESKGRKECDRKPTDADANGSADPRRRRSAKADSDESDDELTNDNEESQLSNPHATAAPSTSAGEDSQSQTALSNHALPNDTSSAGSLTRPAPRSSASQQQSMPGPANAHDQPASASSQQLGCQSPQPPPPPSVSATASATSAPTAAQSKWNTHAPAGVSVLAQQLMHSPTPSENGSLTHVHTLANNANQIHSSAAAPLQPPQMQQPQAQAQAQHQHQHQHHQPLTQPQGQPQQQQQQQQQQQVQPNVMSHLQFMLQSNGPPTPTRNGPGSAAAGPGSASAPAPAPAPATSTPQQPSRKSRSPAKKATSKKEREAQKRAEASAAAAQAQAQAQAQPQSVPPATYAYAPGVYQEGMTNGELLKAESAAAADTHEQANVMNMMQHGIAGSTHSAGRMDMSQLLNARQPALGDPQFHLAPSGPRMDPRAYAVAKALVENTPLTSNSTSAKRRKLTHKEVGHIDPFRIFVALKSGLLAEVTGALNTLVVLLADDRCLDCFTLRNWPGLLDLLVELACRFLYDMFADRCFSLPNGMRGSHKVATDVPRDINSLVCMLERTAHVLTRFDSFDSAHCRVFDTYASSTQADCIKPACNDVKTIKNTDCDVKVNCEALATPASSSSNTNDSSNANLNWSKAEGSDDFDTLRRLFRKACCSANRCATVGCDGLCNAKRRRLRISTRDEPSIGDADEVDDYGYAAEEEDILADDFAFEEPDWLSSLSDSEQQVADRCCAVMLVLRNLSFIPENHAQMAAHSGLLALCASVLLTMNLHAAKPLPNPITPQSTKQGVSASASVSASTPQGRFEMRWVETVASLRECGLVLLSNIAPRLDLARHDDKIARMLVSSLLRWLLSESAIAVDAFQFQVALPHTCSPLHTPNAAAFPVCNIGPTSNGLSAQRLALETICRLCLQPANIDLILAAIGRFDQKRALVERILNRLCACSQTGSASASASAYPVGTAMPFDEAAAVQREFLLILLTYLVTNSADFAQFVLVCDKERAFLVLFDYLDAAFAVFSHPHALSGRGADPGLHQRISADLARRCLAAVRALLAALRTLSPRRAAGVVCRLEARVVNYAFSYDRAPAPPHAHQADDVEQHAEIRRLLADLLLRCRDWLATDE